jgi:transcriptional antiterminator RfaH
MNNKWIVATTKPNKEKLAYVNLIRQGFSVFLPKIKKITTVFSSSNILLKPLFPGYIFIDISKVNWVKINSTYGVKEVLAIDGNPLYVPEKILNLIKSKCDKNDVYQKKFYLKKGEKVRLNKGQNLTLDCVFDEFIDFKRSSILVKLLNQQFKIVVENSLIEI